jgi:hypothetical protein
LKQGISLFNSYRVFFFHIDDLAKLLRYTMVRYSKVSAVAAALLLPCASAQFVSAPSDLITKKGHAGINVRYKEVPAGICEQDPNVKSYSGYADVGENEHIFW